MTTRFRLLAAGALAVMATLAPAPARAQVCNGLPLRGHGMVAASYLSGDAADSPYALRQYGAEVVQQLHAWSPWGTHQAIRLQGAAGSASLDVPGATREALQHFGGSGGSAGAAYTVDVLPNSYAGEYVICLSAGAQGEWWRVGGLGSGGVVVPAWLSFGVPLRAGFLGAFPHASFGGYWRSVGGNAPEGRFAARGIRPWSEAGIGIMAGPARLDAVIRHEFKARERIVMTVGVAR